MEALEMGQIAKRRTSKGGGGAEYGHMRLFRVGAIGNCDLGRRKGRKTNARVHKHSGSYKCEEINLGEHQGQCLPECPRPTARHPGRCLRQKYGAS